MPIITITASAEWAPPDEYIGPGTVQRWQPQPKFIYQLGHAMIDFVTEVLPAYGVHISVEDVKVRFRAHHGPDINVEPLEIVIVPMHDEKWLDIETSVAARVDLRVLVVDFIKRHLPKGSTLEQFELELLYAFGSGALVSTDTGGDIATWQSK